MTFPTKEKQQFLEAEIARLHALLDVGGSYIRHATDEIAKLRAALEAQLEAHNYAEVLEIARKALANEQLTAEERNAGTRPRREHG